jgi:hypothetical protein
MTGGSTGSSLDTGAGPDSFSGDNTADANSVGGSVGSGGTSRPDGSGAAGGIAVLDAWGMGGALGTGGISSIDAAGGGVGSGGVVGIDSPVATGGTGGALAAGGSTSVDVPAGSGGAQVLGGALGSGGSTSSDGPTGSGGALDSGSPLTGGNSTTGGTAATGGVATTGGTTASGGVAVSGGNTASGGVTATGGTIAVVCGTAKSVFSETETFGFLDGGTSPLSLSPAVPPVGAQLGYTTAGPASNPTLCTAGCATLSMAFTAGMAKYLFLSAIQGFASVVNLVGATVTFTIAIDNPGGVPIQVQAYATGDASTTWAWTTPTTINGTALTSYAAATGFKDLSVAPVDGTTTKYCSSASAIIGLQLQNTLAITAANVGTVTIYISKIAVKPPA